MRDCYVDFEAVGHNGEECVPLLLLICGAASQAPGPLAAQRQEKERRLRGNGIQHAFGSSSSLSRRANPWAAAALCSSQPASPTSSPALDSAVSG